MGIPGPQVAEQVDAMMMTMASCSSSDDEVAENNNADVKLVPMTFTATQETNVGTRAALDGENKVNWLADDEISLFDGVGNQKFTLTFDDANSTYTSSFSFTSGNSKTITLRPATGEETIAAGTL